MNQILENPQHSSPSKQASGISTKTNLWQALRNETKGKFFIDPVGAGAIVALLGVIAGVMFGRKKSNNLGATGGPKRQQSLKHHNESNSSLPEYNPEECGFLAEKLEAYLKKIESDINLVPNLSELSQNKTVQELKDWFAGFRIFMLKSIVEMINGRKVQSDDSSSIPQKDQNDIFIKFEQSEEELKGKVINLESQIGKIQSVSLSDINTFDIQKLEIQKERIINHIAFLNEGIALVNVLIGVVEKNNTSEISQEIIKEAKLSKLHKLKKQLKEKLKIIDDALMLGLMDKILTTRREYKTKSEQIQQAISNTIEEGKNLNSNELNLEINSSDDYWKDEAVDIINTKKQTIDKNIEQLNEELEENNTCLEEAINRQIAEFLILNAVNIEINLNKITNSNIELDLIYGSLRPTISIGHNIKPGFMYNGFDQLMSNEEQASCLKNSIQRGRTNEHRLEGKSTTIRLSSQDGRKNLLTNRYITKIKLISLHGHNGHGSKLLSLLLKAKLTS